MASSTLTQDEQEELALLRRSAVLFITDPMEKAFFTLDSLLDSYKRREYKIDSVMPTNAFHVLAEAVKEMKRDYVDFKKEINGMVKNER